MKYMALLTESFKRKFANNLSENYALVFDGWTSNDTHFMDIFESYPSDKANVYFNVLLYFSPIDNEEELGAEKHFRFTTFVMSLCGNS